MISKRVFCFVLERFVARAAARGCISGERAGAACDAQQLGALCAGFQQGWNRNAVVFVRWVSAGLEPECGCVCALGFSSLRGKSRRF
jgi:hypothetical protein